MKYFFVPGRISNLAVAELKAVLGAYFRPNQYTIEEVDSSLLLLNSSISPDEMSRIFNRLGGFIKYGEVIEDLDTFLDQFESSKKVVFGISVHGPKRYDWNSKKIKDLLEQIKKNFKAVGIKSRYIIPKRLSLNSAQVIKNALITKGFELGIFESTKGTVYGRTLGVQDIDLFSLIGYGKPHTDKEMGVLPTKLAKILINFAGLKEGSTIWDPFCGSGTIPLMALVNGYNAIGSDIDENSVAMSEKNIKWLGEQGVVGNVKYDLFKLDVLNPDGKLLSDLRKTEVDAIVCEPFMGPPQYKILSVARANELLEQVADLYKALFEVIDETKKRRIRLVIILPSFKTKDGWATLSLNDLITKRWEILNKKYGEDLHWKRPNSIIKRNIFILSRKN